MKTYEQILDEVLTAEYQRINPVAVNIHKNVAKEYAKQWVEYSHKMQFRPIEMIKKEIDAQ